jgi:hypothetical protein
LFCLYVWLQVSGGDAVLRQQYRSAAIHTQHLPISHKANIQHLAIVNMLCDVFLLLLDADGASTVMLHQPAPAGASARLPANCTMP